MSFMKSWHQKLLVAAAVMVGFGLISLIHAPKAAAIQGTGVTSTGTFNGSGAQTGTSIPGVINSGPELIAYMQCLLWRGTNGGNCYGIPNSTFNEAGAAFLVETMVNGTRASGTTVAINNTLIVNARN